MARDTILRAPTETPLSGAATEHHRPRAVTFVAGLSIVEGIVAVALAGVLLAGWRYSLPTSQALGLDSYATAGVLLGVSGCALLLSAVGLLLLRSWAWTLAMATQCLTLTVSLYEYLSNEPDYLVMALGVLAVLLLNRQEVRHAFESDPHHRE